MWPFSSPNSTSSSSQSISSGNLFGATSGFGQTTNSSGNSVIGNLFVATSGFGQTTNSSGNLVTPPLFGHTTPGATSSASSSVSSVFAPSSSPASGSSISFAGTHGTTPLFGCCGFQQPAFGINRGGSRISSYTDTPEEDSKGSGGKIKSICAMHTYKDKSQEELRFEDYQLGDKGTQCTTPSLKCFGFGQPAFGINRGGSRISSYTDTPEDSTASSGKIKSICAMDTYKDKSHDELRFEDYQLGDKGTSGLGVSNNSVMGISSPFKSPQSSQSAVDQPLVSQSSNPFSLKRAGTTPLVNVFSTTTTNPFSKSPQSTISNAPKSSSFNFFDAGSRVPSFAATRGAEEPSSISAMPIYCNKSHEELRFEHYQLANKDQSRISENSTSGIGAATSLSQLNPLNSSSACTASAASLSPWIHMGPKPPLTPASSSSTSPIFSENPRATSSSSSLSFSKSLFTFPPCSNALNSLNSSSACTTSDASFSPWIHMGPKASLTPASSSSTTPVFSQNPRATSSSSSLSFSKSPLFTFPPSSNALNPLNSSSACTASAASFSPWIHMGPKAPVTPAFSSSSTPIFSENPRATSSSTSLSFSQSPLFTFPPTSNALNPLYPRATSASPSIPFSQSPLFVFPPCSNALSGNELHSSSFSTPSSTISSSRHSTLDNVLNFDCKMKNSSSPLNLPTFPTSSPSSSLQTPVINPVTTPESNLCLNCLKKIQSPQQSQFTSPNQFNVPPGTSQNTLQFIGAPQPAGTSNAIAAFSTAISTQPSTSSSCIGVQQGVGQLNIIIQQQPTMLASEIQRTDQLGISSLYVYDRPSSFKRGFLMRNRHSSLRRNRMPPQKYHSATDRPKVPFLVDKENTPGIVKEAVVIPRENPRNWIRPTTKEFQGMADSCSSSQVEHTSNVYEDDQHKVSAYRERDQMLDGNSTQQKDTQVPPEGKQTDDKEDDDPIMPNLQRADYYTVPSIQELIAKEKEEPDFCCRVKDFIIGRKGYGSVKFLGETDVRKLDLDCLVHFNCREVIVYADDSKKPPVGQGLNKPAEVTMLNVRCIDNKTGKEYEDGALVDRYRDMLIKKSVEHGAEFVSYDPAKGEWIFRVSHF